MKKIFSILFIAIICIQFLPIKQMGKYLYDNTFIEEEMAKKEVKAPAGIIKECIAYQTNFPQSIFITTTFFSSNTVLLSHPISEITTPPPNA
jgi:hypothetical protein